MHLWWTKSLNNYLPIYNDVTIILKPIKNYRINLLYTQVYFNKNNNVIDVWNVISKIKFIKKKHYFMWVDTYTYSMLFFVCLKFKV